MPGATSEGGSLLEQRTGVSGNRDMATNAIRSQERTAVRPKYISLGRDEKGAVHTYRTTDETVHVVDEDGNRTHLQPLGDKSVDEWMGYVDARRGWNKRDYGLSICDMLEMQLGGDN